MQPNEKPHNSSPNLAFEFACEHVETVARVIVCGSQLARIKKPATPPKNVAHDCGAKRLNHVTRYRVELFVSRAAPPRNRAIERKA